MSYILDALRRSQREQRRGQPPDLRAVYREGPPPKGTGPRRWRPWAAAVLVVLAAVLAWVFWPRPSELVGVSSPAPAAREAESDRPGAPEARRPAAPEAPVPGEARESPAAPDPRARRAGETRSLAGEAVVRELPSRRAPEAASAASLPEEPSPAAAAPTPPAEPPESVSPPAAPAPRSAEPPPPSTAQTPVPPVRPFQKPAGAAAPSREDPPLITQLPLAVRTSLPKLEINGHVWSEDPAQRFVFINWKSFREGDRVGEGGPRLERITPEGVVVDFGTARALIPVQ